MATINFINFAARLAAGNAATGPAGTRNMRLGK
jgi:hypothetical protein